MEKMDSHNVPITYVNGCYDYEEYNVEAGKQDGERGDGEERQQWSRKSEYILSLIGFSVGLGNIWRFPYVCMRNGGGAFLIPFFISLVVCALPMFVIEAAIGQFLGRSVWHAWSICPLFKGIGVSMNLLCLFICWYYSMILAWCVIYLVNSFKSPLPWTLCGQSWNTAACVAFGDRNASFVNQSMYASSNISNLGVHTSPEDQSWYATSNTSSSIGGTNSSVTSLVNANAVSSSQEFWLHNVLEISSGLNEIGGFPWHTVVALVAVNVMVLFAIINGVRTSGKVVYVTATLPYILLTFLIIAGLSQPGAFDGIVFYIKPDFSKLTNINTWVEAFIQVFYSLGVGIGSMITMASYNKFNNNCVRYAIMLSLCCEGTSVFGGFAIFSVLGHLSYISNTPIENYAQSGAGLAFIVYPEAISYLPLPQLWGVLFFLMLLSLGLDSQFVNIETMMTTFADFFPRFAAKWRKSLSIGAVAILTVMTLVFTTRGGMYLFQLVDWYYAAFTYLIQTALECVIVAWIYGTDRFNRDIEMMIGHKPHYIFTIYWKFITPTLLMVIFVTTLVTYKPPVYEGYEYSSTAVALGWLFAVFPFLTIIVWCGYELLRRPGTLAQRLKSACEPGPGWLPNDPAARHKYRLVVMQDRHI